MLKLETPREMGYNGQVKNENMGRTYMAKTKEIKYPKGKNCRRVRSASPYLGVMPFIMKQKNDATNMFIDEFKTASVDRYLHKKRAEGMPGLGILHVFIAAYIRVASQYPGLNRFIRGQRLYTRNNIEYVMSVKRELKSDAEDSSIKVVFELTDTLEDVYRKMEEAIAVARQEGDSNTFDNVARVINHLPTILLRWFVSFMQFLDYFGIMPKIVEEASPFHSSVYVSNLGSLGIPPIYHHLYNFGNTPMFITFGAKRRELQLNADGTTSTHTMVDYTIVTDERTTDGHYLATALKGLEKLFRNPEKLDTPPETVVEDVD